MSVMSEVLACIKEDVTVLVKDINWDLPNLDPDDCLQMIEIKCMFIRINQRIDAITLAKASIRPTMANTKGEVNE